MSDKELSGRELDAAVDESIFEMVIAWENGKPFRLSVAADPGKWIVPSYSQSIEAAMRVEDRIAELNLRKQYLVALGRIVAKAATDAGEIVGYWHFTHATAEQRCRAALAAIETKE